MKLETRLKLRKLNDRILKFIGVLVKPLAKLEMWIIENNKTRLKKKVDSMTEQDVIDSMAKTIIKELGKHPKYWTDIHIVSRTYDHTERNIVDEMTCSKYGRVINSYAYRLDHSNVDVCRRLTNMLHDKMIDNKLLDVEWKEYKCYGWDGYEKTLLISVKKEYI